MLLTDFPEELDVCLDTERSGFWELQLSGRCWGPGWCCKAWMAQQRASGARESRMAAERGSGSGWPLLLRTISDSALLAFTWQLRLALFMLHEDTLKKNLNDSSGFGFVLLQM